MNYPTSKDDATSLPNPTGTSKQNNPDHGALHIAENAAIIALENKLGVGDTTPAANTLLVGTGAGTSAWSQATSAQLAASISDETGSGSAVFANTPTLITPKIDTIQEATLNNGVTVAGVNMKNGAITTPSAITANNLAANAVTAGKLGLSSTFTGGIQSYTNTGNGGGTFYYINLGGMKFLWGTMPSVQGTPGGSGYVLNFPNGFFSTIPAITVTINAINTTWNQSILGNGVQTSNIFNFGIYAVSNTSGEPVSIIAIGI